MSLFERLEKVDVRAIYLLLFLVISLPLIKPIGMPITTSQMTIAYYDVVEKLKAGDYVVVSSDFSPASMAEQYPATKGTLAHLVAKGAKIVGLGFWADSVPLLENAMKATFGSTKDNPKYGTDFVLLGWVPNGEVGMAALGKDVQTTCPKDYYGTAIGAIPMMKDIKSARDFKLLITIASGTPGVPEWLRQWQAAYGTTTITAVTAVSAPATRIYFPAQVGGVIEGLAGAAEYEVLLTRYGYKGTLVPPMDAQSLSHLLVIAFIVLGNIAFAVRKYGKGK